MVTTKSRDTAKKANETMAKDGETQQAKSGAAKGQAHKSGSDSGNQGKGGAKTAASRGHKS